MSWPIPPGLDAALLAFIGAALLAAIRQERVRRWGAVLVPLLCLALVARAAAVGGPAPAAIALGIIAALIALGAALVATSAGPTEAAAPAAALLGGVLLATLADNLFLSWLGTLVAAAGLARQAPRRSGLILVMLLLLVLLGLVLLAAAARPAIGPGILPVGWNALLPAAGKSDPALLGAAAGFLLLGFGGIAGLVPLQAWMRGSETVALAIPFANLGLLDLLRLRVLLAGQAAAPDPAPVLIGLGLLSVLAAGIGVWRAKETPRLLGWIAAGQSGLAALAFGLGSLGAASAGLLQIVLRSLALAACIHLLRGPQGKRHACVVAALLTAAALPPAGTFASLFLIAVETLARSPLLAIPLAIGVVATATGLLAALPRRAGPPDRMAEAVAWVELGLALVLGLGLAGPLAGWMRGVG
jgi:hydrogenase-4 component F